jgi:hypothetical protein
MPSEDDFGYEIYYLGVQVELSSDMWSSDSVGSPKDEFAVGDVMYVTVPAAGQTVTFYVTTHHTTWNNGDTLTDVSGGAEEITLNPSGNQTIQIWPPPLTVGIYDIVMDANNNAVYDAGIDRIDSLQMAGVNVIPEMPPSMAIAFFLSVFIATAVFAVFKRFRPRLQPK